VDNKRRYLIGNWVNLAIIVLGFPLLWMLFPLAGGLRALRLIVMLSLLLPVSNTLRKVLARHNLGTTLLVCFMVIIIAGTLMSSIDPNVETPLDGIWWAWVTVTTVGYGDIVPGSTAGRLFGAVLILMGIGLFTMLTASFAAFFMAEDEKEMLRTHEQNINKLKEIENRMIMLERKLDLLLSDEQRARAHAEQDKLIKHPHS
jgi:voltage-gated potassium channel